DWGPLEIAEASMDTLVAGLVECGGRAAEVVVGAAAPDAPGTVYTAVRTLLESGALVRAVDLAAEHAPVDAAIEEAVLRAFQHAHPIAAAARSVPALLAAPPALAWLAIDLAAATATPLPAAALAPLAAAVPPERQARFVRALGQLGDVGARALLPRWADAPDVAVRQEVAIATLLLGGGAAAA